MNREIKFSYIFQHEETGFLMEQIFSMEQIEGTKDGFIQQCNKTFGRYSLVTRRQLTGFNDKNNSEIYEYDIIECEIMTSENIDYWSSKPPQYVVVWNEFSNSGWSLIDKKGYEKRHKYLTPLPFDINSHWEKIGNVFEGINKK